MARVTTKIRAAALADLQEGQQPAVVAERYGLDPAVVRVWKQRYVAKEPTDVTENVTPRTLHARPSVATKQAQIGELVLDLLAAKLKASAAIAEAASNPAWIEKQSGSELAALGEWLDATAFAIGDRLAGRADHANSGTESDSN